MKLSDFHYDLPKSLIAQRPCAKRSGSRLLVLYRDTGDIEHRLFSDLPDYMQANDLMIFNDSRVIPARLYGQKTTGGKVEILVERVLNEHELLAHVGASKSPKYGTLITLDNGRQLQALGRQEDLFHLRSDIPIMTVLKEQGHMPLPPYIDRGDEITDQQRYQTVYATVDGSVAAPTAGLHYDQELLAQLADKAVQQGFVTLHVGAGTFQSVRCENIREHKMHTEVIDVPQTVVEQVRQTQQRNNKVVAVGTTSLRSMETAARAGQGQLQTFTGESDLFVYPGFNFQVINALQTNFHLPESTLIMLVAAFAGYDNTMRAYREAVKHAYRFFSYGDSMLIL